MMEEMGTVFNIQKFSVHDGPGIRTTVFLKGCPLRCAWCANPESQRMRPEPMWNERLCVHCGQCVAACPQGLRVCRNAPIKMPQGCTGCMACVQACPTGAMEAVGEAYAASAVVAICLQDQAFYETSGGGVTISGGEPLTQPAFCKAVLQALKGQGIHTALETTGYVARDVLAEITPLVDLFLFDIKHVDAEKHLKGTGVSSEKIWGNLQYLLEADKQLLVRIPVIPGHNDTLEDAAQIGGALHAMGVRQAQPLGFHQFGEGKYARLGKDYAYAGVPSMPEEALAGWQHALALCGLHCIP